MSDELKTRSLADCVVLLALAELSTDGETPAHTGEVRRACDEAVEEMDGDTLGSVSEAEVNRALNRLEADDHVVAEPSDGTSAVGKGRPRFVLEADLPAVVSSLAADDRVAELAAELETSL
jgi:Cdc6-like AAA superfamily ATPase